MSNDHNALAALIAERDPQLTPMELLLEMPPLTPIAARGGAQ